MRALAAAATSAAVVSRIAVIEDDTGLRDLLRRGLEREGFAVRGFPDAAGVVDALAGEQPDAVVIDIGLPDADGRDLCQAMRAAGVAAPVVFLTARTALSDRLSGFHMGGDDYLVKPFAFEELVVRIRALLRRNTEEEPNDKGFWLDPVAHAAHADGATIALTPTEFRVFAALAARPGEVIRRHDLIAAAWPAGAIVHDNTLDSYIARIRRKLCKNGVPSPIATVHGVGYRLK